MKNKIKKTQTCEWIVLEPVEGQKNPFESEEEFLSNQNLLDILKYRANLLLQETGLTLSLKLSNQINSVDVWNDT